MTSISTHVLDTSSGLPAVGVRAELYQRTGAGQWHLISAHLTNADGRVPAFVASESTLTTETGQDAVYRLQFDVGAYFEGQGKAAFFPEIQITFRILEPLRHHHVPVLLSPFGYTTYRGS